MALPLRTLLRSWSGRHGTGLQRDDPSHRYPDIGRLALPSVSGEAVSIAGYDGPVRNQGGTNSCVAQAILDSELTTLRAKYGYTGDTIGSCLELYYGARLLGGSQNVDAGCQPSKAVAYLAARGIAPESAWPWRERYVNVRPPVSTLWDARQRRGVRGTFAIYDRGSALIAALLAVLKSGRAVAYDVPVDRAMTADRGDTRIRYDARGSTIGYHMLGLRGLEQIDGKWWGLTKNSWGANWRAGGYAWFDEPYLQRAGYILVVDPEEPPQ